MAYAFGTILMGFAASLLLAWRKREWPFVLSEPDMPAGTTNTALEAEGSF